MVLEDPLRFIINTGTTEIHLRASTVAEKINWVNALKKAQVYYYYIDGSFFEICVYFILGNMFIGGLKLSGQLGFQSN